MAEVRAPDLDDGPVARGTLAALVKRLFAWAHAKSLVAVPFIGALPDVELRPWLDPQVVHRLGRAPGAPAARHADLLVVVGVVSQKLAPVLQRAYAELSHPALVVHVTGARDPLPTYAQVDVLSEVVPVDLVLRGVLPTDANLARAVTALDALVLARRGLAP